MDAGEFLTKMEHDSSVNPASQEQAQLSGMSSASEKQDVLDAILNMIFKHYLILFLLVLLPVSFLIKPVGTMVFSIIGLLSAGMVFLNGGILAFSALLMGNSVTFKRAMAYSIPVSVVILLFGGISITSFFIAGVLNYGLLIFLFNSEISFSKAFFLNMLIIFVDAAYFFVVGALLGIILLG